MSKQKMVFSVYAVVAAMVAAVYVSLSLLLTSAKTMVFWIGFGMVIFSAILTAVVILLTSLKRSSAFPLELSIITVSVLYVGIVVAVNLVFGFLFKVKAPVFTCTHILALALYVISIALLFVAKTGIMKQNTDVNDKIGEMQAMIYRFEAVKSKLIDMQGASKKKALTLMDSLLEDLRFSNFGLSADALDMDTKLRTMAEALSAEVDNLIAIQSEDITSMEAIVHDIQKVIKDRNCQIAQNNHTI